MPYSDAIFLCAFPRECTEAFLEGHMRAFAFFGGVPRRITYDNSKIAVAQITGSRDRKVTDAFLRLKPKFQMAKMGISIVSNDLRKTRFSVSGYILINRSASACSASASVTWWKGV